MNDKNDPVDKAMEMLRSDRWPNQSVNSELESRILAEFQPVDTNTRIVKHPAFLILLSLFLLVCCAFVAVDGISRLKGLFISINGKRFDLITAEDGSGVITIDSTEGRHALIKLKIEDLPQHTTPKIVKSQNGDKYNFEGRDALPYWVSKETIEAEVKRPYKTRVLHKRYLGSCGYPSNMSVDFILGWEPQPYASFEIGDNRIELYMHHHPVPRGDRRQFLILISHTDKYGVVRAKMIGAGTYPADPDNLKIEYDSLGYPSIVVTNPDGNSSTWGPVDPYEGLESFKKGEPWQNMPFEFTIPSGIVIVDIERSDSLPAR